MNNNAELWTSLQDGSANTGMHQWFDESFADYIQSGGTITQATGLIASVSSGVAYINGRRLTFNAFSKQVTPAKDTYFDIVAPSSVDNIATVSYVELASGATGSVPTSNGIHLGFVNSASSSIATVSQIGADKLGNMVYLTSPTPSDRVTNAYKFRVSLSANQSIGAGVWTRLSFDTRAFDTGNNVDLVGTKGRFTAPVSGYYYFSAHASSSQGSGNNPFRVALYKNGSVYAQGLYLTQNTPVSSITDMIRLSAGEYVEVYAFNGAVGPITVVTNSQTETYFSGFLVSKL